VLATVTPLITIEGYPHPPLGTPDWPTLTEGDAILVSATFGLEPTGLRDIPADNLILDVTHDPSAPWAATTSAAFAFASLRKSLPVADGGVAWTNLSIELPALPKGGPHDVVVVQKMLDAMILKTEYLDGAAVDKAEYLRLAREFEEEVAELRLSQASIVTRMLLPLLPVDAWRTARLRNSKTLATLLASVPALVAHETPFGVVLELEGPRTRDKVRSQLIECHVYPAVLWELDQTFATQRDISWSQRMLFVHTDFRYGSADLQRVSTIICDAVGKFR